MARPAPRRVAVTGLGVVAPCGVGLEAFWAGLNAPAPEPVVGDDGQVVAGRQVVGFDAGPYYDNPKLARRADRVTHLAVAAATEALAQAGDVQGDPVRRGVLVATGIGGIGTLEEQILLRAERGARRVSPFLVPMMMANASAAAVSMRFGWQGPCQTQSTACAAGTHALVDAARWIREGRCQAVIAGGTEAAMTPTSIAGFTNMTALSSSGRSMPFSAERDGFVISEGAAILVLEEWEAARARGATILAEVLGGASTADAHHVTAPSPGGRGALSCMELALEDAELSAGDIVHVNAHGTSTPLNDAAEAEAMAKLFGGDIPPITATKGVTGHSLGAAGAIEAVAEVQSYLTRTLPPTGGTNEVARALPPHDLVEGQARSWEPGPTLSNSFGFGGHNGTLVLAPA
ncbi:MAG: beta-ketoacyl synthase [Acidimicrobiia bacterium]